MFFPVAARELWGIAERLHQSSDECLALANAASNRDERSSLLCEAAMFATEAEQTAEQARIAELLESGEGRWTPHV